MHSLVWATVVLAAPSYDELAATVAALSAKVETLTVQLDALKAGQVRGSMHHKELQIDVDMVRSLVDRALFDSAAPPSDSGLAPAQPSGTEARPPSTFNRRRAQDGGSTTTTTCQAAPTKSPTSLVLRPPGELGQVLHGASFTAESDGRLDIDSTGTITLNGTRVAAVGSFAAPNATIGSGGVPEKELHVVGDGSMADADEQLRVVDKTSGMVLALGADSTAAFVQATRPGVGYETLVLQPHGQPVGVGSTDATKYTANGLHVYRQSEARIAIANQAGGAALMMGNQDSGGVDNPTMLMAANGHLYVGDGSSWSDAKGGTFDTDFTFDTANRRLGIGVGHSPAQALDVEGDAQVSGDVSVGAKLTAATIASQGALSAAEVTASGDATFGGNLMYKAFKHEGYGNGGGQKEILIDYHGGSMDKEFTIDFGGCGGHEFYEIEAGDWHGGGWTTGSYIHARYSFNGYRTMLELGDTHNTSSAGTGSCGGSWSVERPSTYHNTHGYTSSVLRVTRRIGAGCSGSYGIRWFVRLRSSNAGIYLATNNEGAGGPCNIDCANCDAKTFTAGEGSGCSCGGVPSGAGSCGA